jgi:hypothetical protein
LPRLITRFLSLLFGYRNCYQAADWKAGGRSWFDHFADGADKQDTASKMQCLGLTQQHLHALNNLPFHERHRDPFDHLIIAQAVAEGMILVTQDRHAALYPVQVFVL